MADAQIGSFACRRNRMSAPEPSAVPSNPTLPLSDEARKAYRDLYDAMEAAIEGTTDVATLEALNAKIGDVDNVLTKDDMYRLRANSELYEALLKQINDTNDGLKALQDQIAAIATGFSEAGKILAAVDKVLSLVPGL
jgi:hypothetical protein